MKYTISNIPKEILVPVNKCKDCGEDIEKELDGLNHYAKQWRCRECYSERFMEKVAEQESKWGEERGRRTE